MARPAQKPLKLSLDGLIADVTPFRENMAGFKGTRSARWNRTVRWVSGLEGAWRKKELISGPAFDCAVIMLSRRFDGTIAVSGSIGSHLAFLCDPQLERQQRWVWSQAIDNLLTGKLTADEAVEMGVTAASVQKTKTAAAKAAKAAKKERPAAEEDEEEEFTTSATAPTRRTFPALTRKRTSKPPS